MQARPLGAELGHVAENEPARRWPGAEHSESGSERGGIRVVRIVDDLRAPRAAFRFQAPLRRPNGGETVPNRIAIRTRGDGRRRRRSGVERVVRPGQCELDLDHADGSVEGNASGPRIVRGAHPHVRRSARTEGDAAPISRHFPPECRVGVIGIDDRRRVVRQVLEQLPLGPRNAFDAAESLEMGRRALRDRADGWPGEGSERGDLATMVRTEFHHGGAVLVVELAQRERNADLVVEVAAGRGNGAPGPQNRGDHLLDRGLAVAAGDADQNQVAEAIPPRRGQLSEGANRIGHENERNGDIRRTLDQGRHRPSPAGALDEFVPVEGRTAHRDEQRARRNRARVGTDALKRDILAHRSPTERRGGFAETHPDHRQTSSACPATAASLNGSRAPSRSWLVS